MKEQAQTREQRILDMVMAPGFQCYPSKLLGNRVVVIDGRTGLDACEATASECFDVLLAEIDGDGSPGRLALGFENGAPTWRVRPAFDPEAIRAAITDSQP